MTLENKTLLFRGVAFAIDTIVCVFIAIGIFGIVSLYMELQSYYLTIVVGLVLLTFRDVFGKSLGKMLVGIDILDNKSKEKASLIQRISKNITTPISIVEIPIIILCKDHRRIGDIISQTETILNADSSAVELFDRFLGYIK